MDTFLTTYRKDYRWPVIPPIKTLSQSSVLEKDADPCATKIISEDVPKPEVHAIQLSSIPSAANTDNQPDGFLGQLYDGNPYLYNVKKGPKDEVKERVFRQRFVTTYQRDFCKEKDIDEKENAAQEKIKMCSKAQGKQEKLSRLRKIIPKLRVTVPKSKEGASGDKEGEMLGKPLQKIHSEYTDSYGKTANLITEYKLLTRKPK